MSEVIKNTTGRPTDYSPELAQLICECIANHSWGLEKVCKHYSDLPHHSTICRWRNKYPEFAEQYREAKINQIEILVDEILDIADDSSNDSFIDENGNEKCNTEFIARSRLRIDTRKWLAAKLVPKVYGKGAEEEKSSTDTLLDKLIDRLALE